MNTVTNLAVSWTEQGLVPDAVIRAGIRRLCKQRLAEIDGDRHVSEEMVPVSVEILDKEYVISCPPGDKDALLESARLLSSRMRSVRDGA